MNPTLSLTLALSLTPTLALTLALTLTTDPSPNPHQVEDLRFFVGCIVAPLEPLLSMAERRAIFSSNPNPDPNPNLNPYPYPNPCPHQARHLLQRAAAARPA